MGKQNEETTDRQKFDRPKNQTNENIQTRE